jgi:NAD(P)-dependent dehydrogenase (short-subunit alcohol dehydrogenase family)
MKNKNILITGGTTGIGLATAQLLAAEGVQVIVTGRNPATLATAKEELPANVIFLQSDSGSLAAAQSLGDEIKKHVAHLDGAFLNAGIGTFAPIEAATPQQYDDMFNVNVRGPLFQLQSLLPLLRKSSSVVFTSSIAGDLALPNMAIYAATKAAVISLGKTLATELAPRGIRVNVISPGPIETPIIKKAGIPNEAKDGFTQKTLLKRWGQPEEVARLARFLLSEDSSYIIGTNMVVDGGARIG